MTALFFASSADDGAEPEGIRPFVKGTAAGAAGGAGGGGGFGGLGRWRFMRHFLWHKATFARHGGRGAGVRGALRHGLVSRRRIFRSHGGLLFRAFKQFRVFAKALQDRSAEIGAGENRPREVRPRQPCAHQPRSSEIGTGHVGAAKVDLTDQAGTGQVRAP